MASFRQYVPSGQLGERMPLLAPLFIAGALVSGAVYQQLLAWLPYTKVAFLLPLGFGVVIGKVAAGVVKAAPCRNPRFAMRLTLAAVGCAVLASWLWCLVEFREEHPSAAIGGLASPATIAEYLKRRIEDGWWLGSTASTQFNGIFVPIFWAIELAEITLAAMVVSNTSNVYCERCREWIHSDAASTVFLMDLDPSYVSHVVRREGLAALFALADGKPSPKTWDIALVRERCLTCNESVFLSVGAVREADEGTKRVRQTRTLVDRAILPPELSSRFDERLSPAMGSRTGTSGG